MAADKSTKALNDMREALTAVREGRTEKPAAIRYEGARAFVATKAEVRRFTSSTGNERKRA